MFLQTRLLKQRTRQRWEELMRKFSDEVKKDPEMKYRILLEHSDKFKFIPKPKKSFRTGSSYEGTWNVFGLSGSGTYTFPNGVIYTGEFKDNAFHGEGELQYPDGTILKGSWDRGELSNKTIVFADRVSHSNENWSYCKMPDRRFAKESAKGLQPAGAEYETADHPTMVPHGYYDVGDGFYEPESRTVYKYDDPSSIVRSPDKEEQQYISEHCRCSINVPIGPMPGLYEKWIRPKCDLEEPPSPEWITEYSNESLVKEETSDKSGESSSPSTPFSVIKVPEDVHKESILSYLSGHYSLYKRTMISASSVSLKRTSTERFTVELERRLNNLPF